MNISSSSNAVSYGKMQINGRSVGNVDSKKPVLSINSGAGSDTEAPSEKKSSIYSNFSKEMAKRLNESTKKSGLNGEDKSDSSMLTQSLTGAMGEIEKTFGKEAATEVMAKILAGTAEGVSEASLVNSIQSGLSGLRKLDPTGIKMKELTESFNKDLGLALDGKTTDAALKTKGTLSLSYALGKHFGSLAVPEVKGKDAENSEREPAVSQRKISEEVYEMAGFDKTGQWGTVEVVKQDEEQAEQLKEAAEGGITDVKDLDLATLIEKGSCADIFQGMASYLEKELQDKESAAFVTQALNEAESKIVNKYGPSSNMAEMLSQVYSKVAADGDSEKLSLFGNYINTTFKDGLNNVLPELQKGDPPVLGGAEAGELQFKGLSEASLAGENDVFSFNWGYKDNSIYDQSTSKRFLQEDIQKVKKVQKDQEEAEVKKRIRIQAETTEQKMLRESQEAKTVNARANGPAANQSSGIADGAAKANRADAIWDDFSENRRQENLREAMDIKFGQLQDGTREKLEEYLKNNFSEEDSEQFIENMNWNDNLMSGLASIHNGIREKETGENKAEEFVNFLNSQVKGDVDKITNKLEGLAFNGWQGLDGSVGELEGSFKFNGLQEATQVTILNMPATEQAPVDAMEARAADEPASPGREAEKENTENQALAWHLKKDNAIGYLINLMA